ncbi:hypothetical protein EDD86DRAFT_212585 [Gorgonomyces haynaldii]|nr:hypothetical protein EDD86DRAFT_212585 [Gorgonomyces haynaldii]
MGCGASKELSDQVVLSTLPPQDVQKTPMTKPLVPSISAAGQQKPVAFEIPLDDLLDRKPQAQTRISLPKLSISHQDIQAKLADTEARWKVGAQLDRLLVDLDASESQRRKKGDKPKLRSRKHEEDPETIKKRLQEKIEAATINRQREIERLQAKLALHEERAKKVQERKKALGGGSTDDLRLSVGGETGLAKSLSSKSSSSQDSSFQLTNRGGSGRSVLSDTTDVSESARESVVPNPLKNAAAVAPVARATRI